MMNMNTLYDCILAEDKLHEQKLKTKKHAK